MIHKYLAGKQTYFQSVCIDILILLIIPMQMYVDFNFSWDKLKGRDLF